MKSLAALFGPSKSSILIQGMAAILAIGLVDYWTTWELSLFVFYGVPIFFIAWRGHRQFAVFCALLSALVWFLANASSQPYETTQGYAWAMINRLAYFIFVAVGATAMRLQRLETRARIESMTRARELEQEIVRISEREQIRIGQDLHDGLCQNLAAIDCAAACLKADLEGQQSAEAAQADGIQKMLRDAIVEARNIARGIFPVQLDSDGLPAALDDLITMARQSRPVSIQTEFIGDMTILDPHTSMHLYRMAQESLNNALRHAGATEILIRLLRDGKTLRMTICDNGCGIPKAPASGMGLRTMSYRAQLIGAHLELSACEPHGTEISCSVDLRNESAT